MNYRVLDRLLRKDGKRAFWGQVVCFAVAFALLVPASWVIGLQSRADRFDPAALLKFWEERPQAVARVEVQPTREVADLILPFGRSPVESAHANGHRIWQTDAAVRSERDALRRLERHWRSKGFETSLAEGSLLGRRTRDDSLLVAQRSPEQAGALRLYFFDPADGETPADRDTFAALNLPPPPRGSRIMNYTSPGSAPVLAFTCRDSLGNVVRGYSAQMRRLGWEERDLGEGAKQAAREGVALALFRRDGQTVALHGGLGPTGDVMISLVAM